MQKANIADLKNNLSRYLRKVRSGETVLIMERNRPIARIERVAAESESQDRWARLEAAGIVTAPTHPERREEILKRLRRNRPKSKEGVLEALLEERREGR
jgi:antitoxin (DNA-binding transcriptional repressor) of toxin-antitoxin stability system